MKLIPLLCLFVASVMGATTNQLRLIWDIAPDYDTNVSFHVYSQTNIDIPLSGWVHLTNVDFITATNAAKPGEQAAVAIGPAADYKIFYVITASNFTGETDFSDTVYSRRLTRGSGLRIGAQ